MSTKGIVQLDGPPCKNIHRPILVFKICTKDFDLIHCFDSSVYILTINQTHLGRREPPGVAGGARAAGQQQRQHHRRAAQVVEAR